MRLRGEVRCGVILTVVDRLRDLMLACAVEAAAWAIAMMATVVTPTRQRRRNENPAERRWAIMSSLLTAARSGFSGECGAHDPCGHSQLIDTLGVEPSPPSARRFSTVHEEPPRTLRETAADEQERRTENDAEAEAHPPADVPRKDAGIERDDRQQCAADRASPIGPDKRPGGGGQIRCPRLTLVRCRAPSAAPAP